MSDTTKPVSSFETQRAPEASRRWVVGATIFLLVLMAGLIAARIGGPSDAYDNDQPAPMAHIIDVAVNGQWLMQRDPSGKLATKPPMYPWLGAAAVLATGRSDEWVLKLPLLAAFCVSTLIIFDLGRRELGVTVGLLAATFWVANAHTFKLMYTARTDMLVAMWVFVGLWSVQRQRAVWRAGRASPWPLVAIFWLAVAAGVLTKGPPIALAVLWLVLVALWERAGWRTRPLAQLAGMGVAAALVLAWLIPALKAHPEWLSNINREVAERVIGTGSGAKRHTYFFSMLGFFFGRFAPWSVLTLIGGVAVISSLKPGVRWRALAQHRAAWALVWVVMVLIFFMIPKGRRADYLLPAYAGASILAAWVVSRHANAALVMTVVFAIGFVVYFETHSPAATTHAGEAIHGVVAVARAELASGGGALACYRVGYTPVQALLGSNLPMDESALDRVADGGVLIVGEHGLSRAIERFDGRLTELHHTPPSPGLKRQLVAFRVASPVKRTAAATLDDAAPTPGADTMSAP